MAKSPSTLRDEEWQRLISVALESSAVLITDRNGVILWVNDCFKKLTGYSREESIGQDPSMLNSGLQDNAYYKSLWDKILTGDVWHGLLINRHKNGRSFAVDLRITPVESQDGRITHFVGVMQDITDRWKAEKRLVESQKQQTEIFQSLVPLMTEIKEVTRALDQSRNEMRAILNATSEAMMLLSPENTITWMNNKSEQFFLLKSRDDTGRLITDLSDHWMRVFGDNSAIESVLKRIDDGRKTKETIMQVWPQKRELEFYSAPVDSGANTSEGNLLVFRDVTKEREVERLKSEFVSHVSHEFRTPLTSIRGYTEMILDGDTGNITSEQEDFLKTIYRNATYLTELVTELLDVSRIEAGALRLQMSEIDIIVIMKEAISHILPQVVSKQQKLEQKLPKTENAMIGDDRRLKQVFINLLSNANKYTPKGGKIRVRVFQKSGHIMVEVEDSGIGITEEDQGKLFTKFFRAENQHTKKVGGTGLGLWITRSLIEMHGGEISVVSKIGEGTMFSVRLPLKPQ